MNHRGPLELLVSALSISDEALFSTGIRFSPCVAIKVLEAVKQDHEVKTNPVHNERRRTLLLVRKKSEHFGFTVQSYLLTRGDDTSEAERITYVDYVDIDSNAAKAGVRAGDVIISINGKVVTDYSHEELISFISSCLWMRMIVMFQNIRERIDLAARSMQLQKLLELKLQQLRFLEEQEKCLLEVDEELSSRESLADFINLCSLGLGNGDDVFDKTANSSGVADNNGSSYESPESSGTVTDVDSLLADGNSFNSSDVSREATAVKDALFDSVGFKHILQVVDDDSNGMIPNLRALLFPSHSLSAVLARSSGVTPLAAVLAIRHQNASFSTGPRKPTGIMAKFEAYVGPRYPRAYKLHRMVKDGCTWCISDMKSYYRIRRDLFRGKRTLTDLSTSELESYVQTSEEISKLVGIVVIAVMPMTIYVIGFAIIFFPRLILTRHFWSNEQRKEFWAYSLRKSADRHYEPIVENLKVFSTNFNVPIRFEDVDQLRIPPLLDFPMSHIVRLCLIHRCFPFSGTKRLSHRAEVIRELDSRQLNELHLVDEMDDQQLFMHLFIRRLQYEGKSVPEMRQLLKTWLAASKAISNDTSLMIHAPILCQAVESQKK
ncbi:hypothetical protein QR680_009494 [Steinernema hermaphroditum]|uniref:PDZ domain-containing protein n=1 Tax=Steinernema hermaphroditum TaxID=289476 RepID=A0AA39IM94_9BILA|nr:hypothetical protein QR680_009494 [Steinernema hermaphroditum]